MQHMLSEVWFESKQSVVRVEVECGSSRSRMWFEWKYDGPTAITACHHGALEAGELSCGCMKADESVAMTDHLLKPYQQGLLPDLMQGEVQRE